MNEHAAAPVLSILLPTYSYPDGVRRILRALDAPQLDGKVEVLIADDSPDDGVQALVQSLEPSLSLPLRYRRNRPPSGAAANWNSLLDEASGRFVWLLHHDEIPLGEAFLSRLLGALQGGTDVLLLDCLLIDPATGGSRQHLPMALRAAIARHAPGYLLRRNAIGPVSCLVARRERYPRFATRLRWLVDVEAYVRLLQGGPTVAACPSLRVGSVLGRSASITAQIGAGLPRLHREELAWLRGAHAGPNIAPWIVLAAGRGIGARAARTLETAAWIGLRAALRGLSAFGVGGAPRAQTLAALGRQP